MASDDIELFHRRNNLAFTPSKLNPLPGIRGGSLPAGDARQLVQYRNAGSSRSLDRERGPDGNSSAADSEDRLRQLELRISFAERSTQSILQDIMRNQSEQREKLRQVEDVTQREYVSREQLESAFRFNRNMLSQLVDRIEQSEQQRSESKVALGALAMRLSGIEQESRMGQQEVMTRRDVHTVKLDLLHNEVDQTARAKDQLQLVAYQLGTDLQQLQARSDTQAMETTAAIKDMRNRMQKLEAENKIAADNIRRHADVQLHLDQSINQLRSLVEQRILELRDAVLDLRTRLDSDLLERKSMEQQIASRLNDIQASVYDESRRREEGILSMELNRREKDHAADLERTRLETKMADLVADMNRRLVEKETKLREESLARCSQLEKALRQEQELRERAEKQLREHAEQTWEAIRRASQDEKKQSQELIMNDKKKTNTYLQTVNEAVNLVEKRLDEQSRQHDKLLSAEILSRTQQVNTLTNKLTDLETQLKNATTSLSETVGGTSAQFEAANKEKELALAELSAKLDDSVELLGNLQEKMLELTKRTNEHDHIYADIGEVRDLVSEESVTRYNDVESLKVLLKESLDSIQQGSGNVQTNIQEVKDNVAQFNEQIQSVKSVLGIKLQTEENTQRTLELKQELERLDTAIKQLQTEIVRLSEPRKELSELRQELNGLKGRTDGLQQEIVKLNDAMEEEEEEGDDEEEEGDEEEEEEEEDEEQEEDETKGTEVVVNPQPSDEKLKSDNIPVVVHNEVKPADINVQDDKNVQGGTNGLDRETENGNDNKISEESLTEPSDEKAGTIDDTGGNSTKENRGNANPELDKDIVLNPNDEKPETENRGKENGESGELENEPETKEVEEKDVKKDAEKEKDVEKPSSPRLNEKANLETEHSSQNNGGSDDVNTNPDIENEKMKDENANQQNDNAKTESENPAPENDEAEKGGENPVREKQREENENFNQEKKEEKENAHSEEQPEEHQ